MVANHGQPVMECLNRHRWKYYYASYCSQRQLFWFFEFDFGLCLVHTDVLHTSWLRIDFLLVIVLFVFVYILNFYILYQMYISSFLYFVPIIDWGLVYFLPRLCTTYLFNLSSLSPRKRKKRKKKRCVTHNVYFVNLNGNLKPRFQHQQYLHIDFTLS